MRFSQFLHQQDLIEAQKYLEEKLILFNQGKRNGQIVFMAGGAASGKGFAVSNFLEAEKFKIRDVDAWKIALLKIHQKTGKFPGLEGLNLKKSADVLKLHNFVTSLKIKDKTLNALLMNAKPGNLPNILFDITAKDITSITNVIDKLIPLGYNPKDIHIVWVLTNYSLAVRANKSRPRIVPDDILLQTHEGAARTMWKFIKNNKLPQGINGAFHIILNNRENTIFHVNQKGEKLDGKINAQGKMVRPLVIKSFFSINLKKEGKPFKGNKELSNKLFDWITDNVPKTALTGKEMGV